MTKVLILGAKGMLGQELVRLFSQDKKYQVTAWDKEELDITNQKKVFKKISTLKPQIIFNAVAYNAVDRCEENEKEYQLAQKINGLAPGYLAEIAQKIGTLLIHYSTDYVFGKEMPVISEPIACSGNCATCAFQAEEEIKIGFKEDALPAPVNKYGESKLLGEREVQKRGEKYYIIRLSKLFGKPGQSHDVKKSFFEIMLELAKKQKELRVVDGEISCFTYAPDLALASKKLVESKKDYGIYHLINEEAVTWFEAAEELFAQLNQKIKIIPIDSQELNRPAKRPYLSTLINTKLEPLRDYREALAEYLKTIKY